MTTRPFMQADMAADAGCYVSELFGGKEEDLTTGRLGNARRQRLPSIICLNFAPPPPPQK